MAEYGALEQCLREGFIDYTIEADQRYVPKILTNNQEKKRKVLDTILSQLYVCDSFLFFCGLSDQERHCLPKGCPHRKSTGCGQDPGLAVPEFYRRPMPCGSS